MKCTINIADYMVEKESFACYWYIAKNEINIQNLAFLIHLLALIAFITLSHFYLTIKSFISLIIGSAIRCHRVYY